MLAPLFEDYVREATGPQRYKATGGLSDSFKIVDLENDAVVATEKKDGLGKWTLRINTSKGDAESTFLVSRSLLGQYKWGTGKKDMEFNLVDDVRSFESGQFKVSHRDYQNRLEISAKDESALLSAIWFCFWYWQRFNYTSSD
ncbi:hypothetical protein [Rubellicoccus peritrichatus]|uniref:Uncharacterized protein n=1 Tax=Rubellicoccus peritrichatus TaxID=3080537 RepID=A0AAQ3QWP8_9BACT|nr:hypothetical protein [Puniceicoccus sp. CR14]WOO42075.1 hypothetical protein RZN69_03175 [Puniceicoccus sp. CR14]